MASTPSKITVSTVVNAPAHKVWECWTNATDITRWCHAGNDWHAPAAENNPVEGGRFKTRMEAKDGSAGFDWEGTYTSVQPGRLLAYAMPDGRTVEIVFTPEENSTRITESFDPDPQHPADMQQQGWQAILDNFKNYVEEKGESRP